MMDTPFLLVSSRRQSDADIHRNQMSLASSRHAKQPVLPVIQQNDPIGDCSAWR